MNVCQTCGFEYSPTLATHCTSCGSSLHSVRGPIISQGGKIEYVDNTPKKSRETMPNVEEKDLKAYMDEFVIAQEGAKNQLSSIIANHYARAAYNLSTKGDKLDKTNLMLIGDSGSGKTYMIKKAAEKLDVPITIQDATVFTTAGYVGRDVESILTDLFIASKENLTRMEYGIIVLDEIDKIATQTRTNGPDVGGKAVQQSLLSMIESGDIEFPVDRKKDARRIKVDTTNILVVAAGAFDGMVTKKRKAKHRIGFTNEEIKQVKTVTQKDLITFGMMAEFVGRMGCYVQLDPITPELLERIMIEPRNNIVDQYKKLYELRGKKWPLVEADYKKIAKSLKDNVLGARGLRFALETKLRETEVN